ncbi:hypothetical protein LEP48_11885 [Isoptericola sp. NEAU-Y5]|uniref:DUF385 domain-containing protein n=1 Tax=Isoptericola luteus TaxID=2879484 RepID=A0ABS7ZHV3_9MICO|nr:hypothetical protein [Isoptericola sp. NEAU-Y5]MCA5894042.1 hypothetical protein [Isoptericola sp. NEAU-Y5]
MPSFSSPGVRRFVTWFNGRVLAWRRSPRWGGPLRRRLTIVRYTGRRTGREFAIPVGFRREGEGVTLRAVAPEAKRWWRNFLGEGAALSLELDGEERSGHAVAHRDAAGRVTVSVRWVDLQGGDRRAAEVPARRAE